MGRVEEEHRDIMLQVKAMIFFSTPHRVSNKAGYLNDMLSLFEVPKDHVQELIPNSNFLHTLDESFSNMCKDLELFSFHEKSQTKMGHNKIIVAQAEKLYSSFNNMLLT